MNDRSTAQRGEASGGRRRSEALLRAGGEESGADGFEALLRQELRAIAEAEPRMGLEGRVLARVRSEEAQRAPGGRRRALAMAVMVAQVLVLVLAAGGGAAVVHRIAPSKPHAIEAAVPDRELVSPERTAATALPVTVAPVTERAVQASRQRARTQRRACADCDGLAPVQLEAFSIAPLRIQPLTQ